MTLAQVVGHQAPVFVVEFGVEGGVGVGKQPGQTGVVAWDRSVEQFDELERKRREQLTLVLGEAKFETVAILGRTDGAVVSEQRHG